MNPVFYREDSVDDLERELPLDLLVLKNRRRAIILLGSESELIITIVTATALEDCRETVTSDLGRKCP